MFTGIIEEVGTVESVSLEGDLARLRIRAPLVSSDTALGDSVSVSGACLTVTEIDGETLSFDAVRETRDCTAVGDLVASSRVNLERAMLAGARLDGHIVQGHVDGVGRVEALDRHGDSSGSQDVILRVGCGEAIAGQLVDKGSVTIDGVSLTVVTAQDEGFDVALIPHTLAETTLSDYTRGRRVNLEVDILGKYVKAYVERTLAQHESGARAPSGAVNR
jgi:riboflavin synthase